MKIEKSEHYLIRGKGFNVLIIHWHTEGLPEYMIEAEEHWCLYVIIHSVHPLFKKAEQYENDDYDKGDEIYPDWHRGCTYYNKQKSYIKIGCDYQHLGDEYFGHCKELPSEIESDAQRLYEFFTKEN